MNAHTLVFLAFSVIACDCAALECPPIPDQAHKDWDVTIKAAVGKIGPLKGAELENRTRTVTVDVLGKLPQADRVYLEQMMYATYCSALRDDKSLTELQKSARIKSYNLEVRKTFRAIQGGEGHSEQDKSPKDAARAELERIPLPYTVDSLVESAEGGNLAAVKLYLAAGMDPNGTSRDGYTALMKAAAEGHDDIVEVLLKAKADVNKNSRSYTALSFAAGHDRKSTVRLLLSHGAIADADEEAIVSAAKGGQVDVLRELLGGKVDKDVGGDALRHAAGSTIMDVTQSDLNEVVNLLLALGVDANSRDEEGWTALLYAADAGRGMIVRNLLNRGANANDKCTNTEPSHFGGWTALMFAAKNGDKSTLDLLLAQGADPNAANVAGATALMLAAGNARSDVVRALLAAGAKPITKD